METAVLIVALSLASAAVAASLLALIAIRAAEAERRESERRREERLMKHLATLENKLVSRDVPTFAALQGIESPTPNRRFSRDDETQSRIAERLGVNGQ